MITGKVNNMALRELKNSLAQLPKELEQKALEKNIRAATRSMADAVAAAAPVGQTTYYYGRGKNGIRVVHSPGTLQKAIAIAKLTKSRFMKYAVTIKHSTNKANRKIKYIAHDAFYWYWVEFGHIIVPRGGKHEASVRKSSAGIKKHRFRDSAETAAELAKDQGFGREGKSYGVVRPNPFIRTTFRTHAKDSVEKIEKGVMAFVQKYSRGKG